MPNRWGVRFYPGSGGGSYAGMVLIGRVEECARVQGLLSSVRGGRSEALSVVGPAGIGKTAFVDYVADAADGMLVLRARGVPSEGYISYAGLSQLLAPALDLLSALPRRQAAALSAALAIGPPVGADKFPVFAATLGVLAAAAAKTPVIVLVDDAHWFDVASLDALHFAQRRLGADRVLIILVFRVEPGLPPPTTEFPILELRGLDPDSAAALLDQTGYSVDRKLLPWIVRASGGNPLALRDLPTFLSPQDFASSALRADPAPIGPILETAYGRSAAAMPDATQKALLIAAMLDGADVRVVSRALHVDGLGLQCLTPAEDAGLVKVAGGVVVFRHPLVRSAVYQIASASSRRTAHLAAADGLQVSSRAHHREARGWHLAEAAIGVDEATASLLEELGDEAVARAGYASAWLTYEKAAQLSDKPRNRVARLLAAASAAFTAGLLDRSSELLQVAAEEAVDPRALSAVAQLRGRLETWSGDPLAAARDLNLQAERIREADPALSAALWADATVAALLAGQTNLASRTAQLVADFTVGLAPGPAALGDLGVGAVQALRGDAENARLHLDRYRWTLDEPETSVEQLEHMIYLAAAYCFIDCFDEATSLFRRAISMARHHGAIGLLPFSLTTAGLVDFRRGAWEAHMRKHPRPYVSQTTQGGP
jgi:hypothetical protein